MYWLKVTCGQVSLAVVWFQAAKPLIPLIIIIILSDADHNALQLWFFQPGQMQLCCAVYCVFRPVLWIDSTLDSVTLALSVIWITEVSKRYPAAVIKKGPQTQILTVSVP